MFNERKAAQVAAWFLRQESGRMPHLKLIKLMYLADRQALDESGFPITGDQAVAMPHGPVLTMTLDLINGDLEPGQDGWGTWISDCANYEVMLRERVSGSEQLDELSAADLDILETVWQRFGGMDKWQIRDYTHDHCPEWDDPQGSSYPIPYERIFEALGRSKDEAARLAERIDQQRSIDRIFASL